MMKQLLRLLPAALLITVMTSCEVEFSPNADWRNVPAVYCVLDQDDDTSWVRVERCHLSNEGVFAHGSNADSINYPEGSIEVSILAYEGDRLRDSIPFHYMLRQRDSGSFAGGMQPIYYSETRGRLNQSYEYVLNVREADGTLLCTSSRVRLIRNPDNYLFTYIKNNKFGFYDSDGTSAAFCKLSWNALSQARLYQPIIRFYYREDAQTRYVDLSCPRVALSDRSATGSVNYARSIFLADLKQSLSYDTASPKEYLKRVDIYLTCCTEDLNSYMSTAAQGSNLEQSREIYSNIQGGIGIFAARRTHLYQSFDADENDRKDVGLAWFLTELGVGIYLP